jgi:hypothetical protein
MGVGTIPKGNGAVDAKLLPAFLKVPAHLSAIAVVQLGNFTAAAIGDKFELVAAIGKSTEHNGTIGGQPLGGNGSKLNVTGLGLSPVQVEGLGQRRSPWG